MIETGDSFIWADRVRIDVVRVMRGGRKVKVICTDIVSGDQWNKDQPIEFFVGNKDLMES